MAEYVQTVGVALGGARELVTAARKIAEAKRVMQRIADRASLIEASLESIRDILVDMRDTLQPMMPTEKYNRLHNNLIMCVRSCEMELNESFGLFDRDGNRVTQTTILQRLWIAANSQKIHEDRATLDSIISQMHLAITTVNTSLNLTRTETREVVDSYQENGRSFRSALNQVNERTQRHNEQVQRWRVDFESDTISVDEVSRVDSVDPLDVSGNRKSLSPETQLALEQKAKQNEWSSIHQALYDSDIDTLELLLHNKPGLIADVDAKGQTPLHHCSNVRAIPNALRKAEVLLQHGADVNSEDDSELKRTPLYLAVRLWTPDQAEMVELLVRSGAKVDVDRLPSRWTDYTLLETC